MSDPNQPSSGDVPPQEPEPMPGGEVPPQEPMPGGYGTPPAGPPPQQPAYGQQPPYGQPQYSQPPYPQPGAPQYPGGPTRDELTWGSAAHWSALVASVIALAFLGPLIVMLTKGNESAYVRRQAVESLNFQLSMLIYVIVSFVLMFVLIGFILLPIVGIAWLALTIIGSIRASRGEEYRYPLTIRMVS